jgi:cyclophilin family peptidyl-prolyl cis-trans isomerase
MTPVTRAAIVGTARHALPSPAVATDKRQRQKAGHEARVAYERAQRARADRRRRITVLVALVVVAALVLGSAALLAGRDDADDTAASTTSTTAGGSMVPAPPGPGATITGETPCPPADGTAERTTTFAAPPPMCIDPTAGYTARFTTSAGTIDVSLDASSVPTTVNNFVVLSRYGYYDDTAIFRADASIDILQGGAPLTNDNSDPGPGYTIPDEGGPFTYVPGRLVMARTGAPNSAGAQWFFTTGPNASNLDAQGTYVVFGTTEEAGLELLRQALASAAPDPSAGYATPQPALVVESVEIIEG